MNVDHPLNFVMFIMHINKATSKNSKSKEVVSAEDKGKDVVLAKTRARMW